MKIGCPKEIKNNENRVGLTPGAARAYVDAGHQVYIESGAGLGSALADEEYLAAGAQILPSAGAVWAEADMIVKVKEPLESEFPLMRESQIIYTYFHFAADEKLTRACLAAKIVAVAYETVSDKGALPLLKPMSEVAGRMAGLMGAFYSAKPQGGRGLLPMGVTGVAPAEYLILGGGTVGAGAAYVAAGLGARVHILDVNLERLERLGEIMPANVTPLYSDQHNMENLFKSVDVIIGAVLIPGAPAPKLVKRGHLGIIKPGAVLVDVAIDQGGCAETSRPTTHSQPTFVEGGVIHYCVANMPGAYSRTSTFALNNATLGYGLKLAGLGAEAAAKGSRPLALGVNLYKGRITCLAVAEAWGLLNLYKPVEEIWS